MTKFIYRRIEAPSCFPQSCEVVSRKTGQTVGYITKADHTGAYMIDWGHSPTIIKATKKAAAEHIEAMADFTAA